MPPAGFEPAIPATERPQTDAADRLAAGVGVKSTQSQFSSPYVSTKLLFQRPHSSRSGQAVAKLAPWAKKIHQVPPLPLPQTHIGQICNFRLRILNVHALKPLLFIFYSLSRKIKVLVTLCREISNSVTRPGRQAS